MNLQPPPDLLPRTRQILLPLVETKDDREALLTDAFYTLSDSRIYHQIKREGTPIGFTTLCIKKLLDYGCLSEGKHALGRLLNTAKYYCGVDKHITIDELVRMTDALCAELARDSITSVPATVTPVTSGPITINTPQDDRQPTVFISYSHQDSEIAQQLIADLNRAGHACWIDTTKIKGGDEWIMTISKGITNSYVFVPLVTLKALQSKWVQDEILWARQKDKLIIPFILENVLSEERFFPLVSYQGVTVFDSDYETALAKLLSYLPNPTLADVDVSDAELEEDDDPPETISISEKRVIPRKLELDYLERLRFEELLNTEKYTAMGGHSQQMHQRAEIRAVFELLPMGDRDPHEMKGELEPFEDAVAEIHRIRRAVLLGEPGGGKTTTIWKLASDLVDKALTDRKVIIPLLIRLGKWTDKTQPLHAFITSQIGDLGAYLDDLLREKRVALLLDGLNEIPASQHKAKYPQVQAFIEAYPDLMAVVSCRELDYTIDLGFDRINITLLDPIRIREFVTKYLEDKGDELFWKLAGENAQSRHSRFLEAVGDKLDDPETTFWIADVLPDGILWGYSWRENDNTYWNNWLKERENPSGLMVLARNPYMLLMLTSVFAKQNELPDNRGELFKEFVETLMEREAVPEDEQEPLVNGLAQVAYAMQLQRIADDNSENDAGNALTVLPEDDVKRILGERLLYLAGSASILSVGEQVRFTHQLLQEYFSATYMDNEIKAGRLKATDIWKPDNWWERTNWEEATILLAGLYSDDPTPIVEWLLDVQPELSAQCITRSGAKTPPDATLLKCREAWLPRLTDLQRDPDPRARASIGRALGQLTLSSGECLDNRKGVNIIVKNGVKLPDIDWVTIPAGTFTYGDDDKSSYSALFPPADKQEITLPEFRISKYPVTYMQFQTFIDDQEGYHDPRWWEGFAMPDGHNQAPDEQWFKFWNHPRERVSWFEAMAFCRWLSHKLWSIGISDGMSDYDAMNPATWLVRLPTEFEWEKSARGRDGLLYPYGNEFDKNKGNTSETSLSQTSAVGIFSHGASPYGVLDMAGNVWDWCLTDYNNPAETASQENIGSSSSRVLRGGSWANFSNFARSAYRNNYNSNNRFSFYGFRLCSSPFSV